MICLALPRITFLNEARALVTLGLAALFALLMASALWAQEANDRRVALLIGNGAYEHAPVLKNPGNDSSDLAETLKAVGFDVTLHTDQGQAAMLDTLRQFQRKARGADIALVYYAGHGIEIDRQNYLIPTDARLETDTDINFEAVPLETMIFAARGAKRLSMVIVDACRDNPFASSMSREDSTRSIGRGLSAVEPTANTLVAYAAKEGTTASDGAGRNSPYAGALIKALQKPGLEVGLMMRQVRDSVLEQTSGQQEPFVYGSLSAEQIFLNDTRALVPLTAEDADQVALAPEPDTTPRRDASAGEIAFWQSIENSQVRAELETYLRLYPNGLYAGLAQTRLARLGDGASTTDAPQDPFVSLVPPTPQLPGAGAEPVEPQESERDLTRAEIKELQERLSVLGHRPGRPDGIMGRRTETAIKAFETDQGLPETGLATLALFTTLQERVSEDDLKDWRAEQARAARARVQQPVATPTRPRQQTPTVTPPATPEPEAPQTRVQSGGDRQFCASHRQCGTNECAVGSSGISWRKTPRCRFCPAWAQKCQ